MTKKQKTDKSTDALRGVLSDVIDPILRRFLYYNRNHVTRVNMGGFVNSLSMMLANAIIYSTCSDECRRNILSVLSDAIENKSDFIKYGSIKKLVGELTELRHGR